MERLLKFSFPLILSTLLYGCINREVTCDKFDEKYAMFIPTIGVNDSVIFYRNKVDSIVFYCKYIGIVPQDPEQICDDERECEAMFVCKYVGNYYHSYREILYVFQYFGNNPNNIRFQVDYGSAGCSFYYYPQNNPITASVPIVDSVLVNDVYYKDVVILTADYFWDKVYVAKNNGLIMFTIKDSDEVWTINKPN